MNPSRGALLKPSERTGKVSTTALSRQRKVSRYEILKDKIRGWWNDRLKIGEALKEIRDEKLYKDEYTNFEDFCVDEFNIKHSQAYALIDAAKTVEQLKPSGMSEEITNPRQANALAKVPTERRLAVLAEVVSQPGPVTAKKITEAAKSNGHATPRTKTTAKGPRDKIGCLIPSDVLLDWRAAEAREDICRQVHRLKLTVEKALEENELVFREITNSTVADLHNAWSALQGLIPYAVCPTCEGHNRATCTLCRQRGYLSRFAYEHYVPKKTRELRERLHA